MLEAIISSAGAYLSANIDDVAVLMILLIRAATVREKIRVTAGQFLGIGILTAVSLAGGKLLSLIPQTWLGLLGLIPIVIGVIYIMESRKNDADDDDDGEEKAKNAGIGVISVALLALADGGDFVGVFVPLFSGFDTSGTVTAVAVCAVLTALWCVAGNALSRLPHLRAFIEKYSRVIVPAVLIILGVYMLLENYLPYIVK